MISVNEFPLIVDAVAIAAIASVISAFATIFGTNPGNDEKHITTYRFGITSAAILLVISIGISTWILLN